MVILERAISKEAFMRRVRDELQHTVVAPTAETAAQPVTITQVLNTDYPHAVGSVSDGRHRRASRLPGTSRGEPIPGLYPRTQSVYLDRLRNMARNLLHRNSVLAASLEGDPATPGRDPATPGRDPASPGRDPASPGRDPASPGRDPASPGRDPATPVRDLATPERNPATPMAGPATPVRDPAIPAHQYCPRTFDHQELTLKQACSVMVTFDLDEHEIQIKRALCDYSLRIHGLEECRLEDLRLAVFLFIEKYFSFQPAIELCVRNIPDSRHSTVVGVLFERSETVQKILGNRSSLIGTGCKVLRNHNPHWIIRNYECS